MHDTGPVTARQVFGVRDFRTLWITSVVSQAGSFMQSVTVPFILHDLTGSNTWVGVSVVAGTGPAVIMAPLAGTLSDRFDRRRILAAANLIQLTSATALWLLAVTGNLTPGGVVGWLVLGGIGSGIQYAVQLALVPLLVPPAYLATASRINSVTYPAARSFGPAIAGLVLAHFGPTWTFGVNAVSFLVVIWGLAVIRPRAAPAMTVVSSAWSQFRDGLRYIRDQRLRLAIATGFTVSALAQSTSLLTAGLVAEDYRRGPELIGTLVAFHGVGALIGSWFLVSRSDRFGSSRMVTGGFLSYAVGIVGAVATTDPRVACLAFLAQGMGHVTAGSSVVTVIQTQLHEEYRGRVMGVHLMGLQLGLPIGAGLGGVIGDRIGLRPTYLIYAAAIVAFIVFTRIRFAGLARFDAPTLAERTRLSEAAAANPVAPDA